jgi:hypothetical protein
MSFTRKRSDRPGSARRTRPESLERLESRELLASAVPAFLSPYVPSDLYVVNPITNQRIPYSIRNLVQHNNPNSPLLSNEGKVVTGKDRAGNLWTITVHGPGKVIVTDTTPNDGSLDDDIATIQIVGSNLRSTYVTGTTVASNQTLTDGTVSFNQLIAADGVKSIVLNGFNLSGDVTPAVTQSPGVFLYGGVQTLKFNDINALIDTAQTSSTSGTITPYQIVIGSPNTPLTVNPSIYLDSINNSVFDSTATTPSTTPVTTPSVQFSINGVVQNFSVVSITQSPVSPNLILNTRQMTDNNWSGVPQSGPLTGAFQFLYNVVGTTGRTSLQSLAINHLNVRGSAVNFTAQRGTTPFQSSLSGMKYLRSASFGGNSDAVGLDVEGPIGKLQFKRGLGNPAGVFTGKSAVTQVDSSQTTTTTVYTPASSYGVPSGSEGYPAHGLLGGTIRATRIQSLKVGPANYITQTAQNPNFVQTTGFGTATAYMVNPGTALTNVAVTTDRSIGNVSVTGNQVNTEIKTGFNYPSYLAGLQGTRSASRIARLQQRGDLVNSVDSATFRPALDKTTGNYVYSNSTGIAGNGSITGEATTATSYGRLAGSAFRGLNPGAVYNTGGRTALGNFGAGFFARRKRGFLPPRN